ncbi:MAG: hypothetical protein M3O36_05570 [Myxococcota bacterium]|nr:hypothetical protein [Myxococcota bacterium]
MTVDQLRRMVIAHEIIALDVTVASLVALERALLLEHPALHAPTSADDPLVRTTARALLRHASRLRRALRVYRGVVDPILSRADEDDELF